MIMIGILTSFQGVIWAIFFHRLLGPIAPSNGECLGITYPTCKDLPELHSLINKRVEELATQEFITDSSKVGKVTIVFKQKINQRKKSGWFGGKDNNEQQVPWEVWCIRVKCLTSNMESSMERSKISFQQALLAVIDKADGNMEHIPPITSLDASPFPYDIEITKKATDESWGSYFKNIVNDKTKVY